MAPSDLGGYFRRPMKVHEIMTAHPRCIAPDNTLVEAAGLMRQLDVGALPICDRDRVVGMVTDRDIVLRGTAEGRDPNTATVSEVMSPGIVSIFADQSVEEATRVMESKQIRRLPVLNRTRRLVGMVSLGDVATSSNPAFSGTALRDVSRSSHPTARQQRLSAQSEPMRMPVVPGERQGPRTNRTRTTTKRSSTRAKTKSSTTSRGRARTQKSTKRRSAARGN